MCQNPTFLKGLTHDFTQKFKNLLFLYFRAKFVMLRQVKAWVERLKRKYKDLFLMTQKDPNKGFHKDMIRYISLK